jgi:hypothetical protein
VNAIKLITCFLHKRSQRQAYIIDEVEYRMEPDFSDINRINRSISLLCNLKHENPTSSYWWIHVLIFWRNLGARCLGNRSNSFSMACPLVLSGSVLGWQSTGTFRQCFWKGFEESLEKCIWFSKGGMLACHKSNYMNYINLSPRYSNLVAINLTTVVCLGGAPRESKCRHVCAIYCR